MAAEVLDDNHPVHTKWRVLQSGALLIDDALPVLPPEPTGWEGVKARRACRRAGGHWWHPADPMIEWACCQCGARRDGYPKDGT